RQLLESFLNRRNDPLPEFVNVRTLAGTWKLIRFADSQEFPLTRQGREAGIDTKLEERLGKIHGWTILQDRLGENRAAPTTVYCLIRTAPDFWFVGLPKQLYQPSVFVHYYEVERSHAYEYLKTCGYEFPPESESSDAERWITVNAAARIAGLESSSTI